MRQTLSISALARRAGVSSRTLRYWEALGLLPRAERSHTGYRLFDPETVQYLDFIRKSKAIGLSLAEMREILQLARRGQCPCEQVVGWTDRRIEGLEEQVRELSKFLRRLKRIRRRWTKQPPAAEKCDGICTLIEELPEAKSIKGGNGNEKTMAGSSRRPGNAGSCRTARAGDCCG